MKKFLGWLLTLAVIAFIIVSTWFGLSVHKELTKKVRITFIDDAQMKARFDAKGKVVKFALGEDGKVYWQVADKPKAKKKGWFGRD